MAALFDTLDAATRWIETGSADADDPAPADGFSARAAAVEAGRDDYARLNHGPAEAE